MVRVDHINGLVYGILEDKHDNIWVTAYNSIYFFPRGNISEMRKVDNTFFDLSEKIEPFDGPYALCYDEEKDIIWVGLKSGILQIRNVNGKYVFSEKEILPSASLRVINNTTVLYYDKSNNSLLFGTKNAGLFMAKLSENGDITEVTAISSVMDREEHIWSMKKASNGQIYVGTDCGLKQLLYKQDGKTELIPVTGDLRIETYKIVSIIEDGEQNLWLSTSMGLLRYSLNNGQTAHYLNTDGLATNILCEGAMFDPGCNCLYIGSIKGINVVDLSALTANNVVPETQFTTLKINNTPILPQQKFEGRVILNSSLESTDKIILKYNENNFTIGFAALHFSNPAKNSYMYMLSGFNNEWTTVDNNMRSATFTNIPPGNYKLLVKSSNGDRIWNEVPLSMDIIIKPAPWQTWWAYLIYVMALAGMLYFIYRYYQDRHKIRTQLLVDRMEHKKEMEIAEVKLKYHTNITHELRTPLSLIIAPVDELLLKHYEDSYLKSQLNIIKVNADRLMQLINQVLDFRKVVNDKYELNVKQENILTTLYEVIDYFTGAAKQKNIMIDFCNDLTTDYCWCDKEIIVKICSNILSNAIKYTSNQGKVSIYASQSSDNSFLNISIEDTGAGIEESELEKIFTRFYQIPGSTGGTGIGLHLCKQLAAIHLGDISVKSHLGEGSIFTLKIPSGRNAYVDYLSTEATPEPLREEEEETSEETESRNKTLILVVEDNFELRDYVTNLFKEEATVISAGDGQEGLTMATNYIPDIIVSDIMMPVMDGIEMTRKCKEDMRTSHIPIILLTAKGTFENEIEGLSYGADDYVKKPFNAQILKLRVKKLLRLTSKKKMEATLETNKLNKREQSFLDEFNKIVLDNIADAEFNIDDVCKIMCVSRMQLYRKLTGIIDKKPSEYIKEIKMRKAYSMLKDDGMNITEVMFEVGYSNYSYFSRRFAMVNGISPREVLGMKK